MSPQAIDFTYNYDKNKHKDWVSPEHSNEVFEKDGVHKVFFLICLLVVIGEFFSSPAVALADSAVITMLGETHQGKALFRMAILDFDRLMLLFMLRQNGTKNTKG